MAATKASIKTTIDLIASGNVLSVRDLDVSFRIGNEWKNVVRNINFDVGAGETVAIVGESGSGKSVTSLAIMRLLPRYAARTEGRILLSGRDLLPLPTEEMRRIRGNEIAMIFQEPMTSLNPVFPVGKQIQEALTQHARIGAKQAKAEAIRLLEKVRIPSAAKRYEDFPHQFSGGMRQRVMIAMALAGRPKLLIADEPTTALDVTIQGQILDLIKQLQEEEGMSVLFITHDMGVVAEISDRTIVMYRGDAVETGQTADIFRHSSHSYTRSLLSAVPVLGSMTGKTAPEYFPILDSAGVRVAKDEPTSSVSAEDIVLNVKNLKTRFDVRSGIRARKSGAVHAVEDVSFSLRKGEVLSLVGESGCGKSTIGRSITRLIEPLSGSVEYDGRNILSLNKDRLRELRRSIQIVFQDPFASLNPRMTVGNSLIEAFLDHGLGSRDDALAKASDLLVKVGLGGDMLKRYPHEFSGGQRQRIAIARALMLDPKIIIADEAVSALDVSIKAQVCNLLLDLQKQYDLSYIFISHDMAVVERVSHRVAVMYMGEIVEIGSRAAIFENPQHAYTKKLIAAVPIPDPSRRHLKRVVGNDEIRNFVRPIGYQPPQRRYRSLGDEHFVQVAE